MRDEGFQGSMHKGRLFLDSSQAHGSFNQVCVKVERRSHTYQYASFLYAALLLHAHLQPTLRPVNMHDIPRQDPSIGDHRRQWLRHVTQNDPL
jgi:hypothetical protein